MLPVETPEWLPKRSPPQPFAGNGKLRLNESWIKQVCPLDCFCFFSQRCLMVSFIYSVSFLIRNCKRVRCLLFLSSFMMLSVARYFTLSMITLSMINANDSLLDAKTDFVAVDGRNSASLGRSKTLYIQKAKLPKELFRFTCVYLLLVPTG